MREAGTGFEERRSTPGGSPGTSALVLCLPYCALPAFPLGRFDAGLGRGYALPPDGLAFQASMQSLP